MQYWSRQGKYFGTAEVFECMGICVLSPAHESKMRGYLVYVLSVKYLSHHFCFKFSHRILHWTALSWNFLGEFFLNIFRGVCGPCHL